MIPLLVRPIHSIPFLTRHRLGVEAHIGRYDILPGWAAYEPFVAGVHLPYEGCNLAALDDTLRRQSIEKLKQAMTFSRRFPVDRWVMHICGMESRDGVTVGAYDRLIEALRELAGFAAGQGVSLCLENTVLMWKQKVRRWGDSAREWRQIRRDVARDNVRLTLDTSHAATAVQRHAAAADRIAALTEFVAEPEAIGRVHWSDSILSTDAGKADMHLVPGDGDLPREFHQAIQCLPVPKLLEQNCSEEDVLRGLNFVASL